MKKVLRRLKNNFFMSMKGSNIRPEGLPRLKQKALFIGKGKIGFGEDVLVGYFPSPLFYSTYAHIEARNETSEIFIDDGTCINNNSYIASNGEKIYIGKNCRIGINFQCMDSDFHGLSADVRDNPKYIVNKPVKICNNVFIGNNVTVLKGVTIGENSVIGSGSVVVKDIPANTVAGGNPAGVIRSLEGGKS